MLQPSARFKGWTFRQIAFHVAESAYYADAVGDTSAPTRKGEAVGGSDARSGQPERREENGSMGEMDEQLRELASRWRERWPGRIDVEVSGPTPRLPIVMLTLTNTENGKDVVHVFEDNGAVAVDDGRRYRAEIPIWSDWRRAVEELVTEFVNRATT